LHASHISYVIQSKIIPGLKRSVVRKRLSAPEVGNSGSEVVSCIGH